MAGATVEFSAAELEASAKAYDPSKHEAPIVIGHPAADAPAYGWVKTLAFAEGGMQAGPDQLDPAFAEAVGRGSYKKVSASFYAPNSSANPVPGVYYLRHVGFLGAQPPAVKGLRQVEFAGTAEDSVTIEFGETDSMFSRALRSLRDFFIGEFGQDKADKALPPWIVDSAQETAAQQDAALSPGFSEGSEDASTVSTVSPASEATPEVAPVVPTQAATQPPAEPLAPVEPPVVTEPPVTPPVEPDPRVKQLDEREAALKKREAELAEKELKAKHGGHAAFLESIVAQGRPLPCPASTIVNFMRLLDGETADVVSFGEGEERSALDLFKAELLSKLPKTVEFSELARSGGEQDDDPAAVAAKAVSFQEEQRAKGIEVSTSEAVAHVRSPV
jgi:hypothetical protein